MKNLENEQIDEKFESPNYEKILKEVYREKLYELLAERAECLAVLKEVEWNAGTDDVGECPYCHAFGEIPEHKPDCRLATLIKKLQSDSGRTPEAK